VGKSEGSPLTNNDSKQDYFPNWFLKHGSFIKAKGPGSFKHMGTVLHASLTAFSKGHYWFQFYFERSSYSNARRDQNIVH
jgi:hypothetical protein